MEKGYTQLGAVQTDQRAQDGEGDGVIVVGRFKGGPYDGVQLSYDAGRRNLYLTPEAARRLAILLAAHAPHHVAKAWADKYQGQFDGGWDQLREQTLERQKGSGSSLKAPS